MYGAWDGVIKDWMSQNSWYNCEKKKKKIFLHEYYVAKNLLIFYSLSVVTPKELLGRIDTTTAG
jgi:hypothetical protein